MRLVNLAKIAAEAEVLHVKSALGRQGRRAAFGVVAVVFGIGTLVLLNVVGWQVLRQYQVAISATLVLLGINLVLTLIFTVLAARSSPGRAEREAIRVRQDAIEGMRSSLLLTTAIPLVGAMLRSRRSDGTRRLSFKR
jgi:hypothetical protein